MRRASNKKHKVDGTIRVAFGVLCSVNSSECRVGVSNTVTNDEMEWNEIKHNVAPTPHTSGSATRTTSTLGDTFYLL